MAKGIRTIGIIAGSVALIATGVGAAVGASGIAGVISAAGISKVAAIASVVSAAAAIGAQALTKPPPARGSITRIIIDPNAPTPYVMGEGLVGPVLRHDVAYGPTLKKVPNPYRFMATVFSLGPVQSISPRINFGTIPSWYNGFLFTDTQLGATPEANALSPQWAGAPGWGPDHKLSGLAAIGWSFLFDRDGERFANGIDPIAAYGKWVKVYDPRKDSTFPGGSGSHRLGNESTYEWSENPALHAGTYAYGRFQNGKRVFGIGMPADGIDWNVVAAWANVCEANGWTIFGRIFEPGDRWANLKDICYAGGAEPIPGGVLTFKYAAPKVALDTITVDDLVTDDEMSVVTMQPYRDRLNTVIPQFISPNHNWELIDAGPVVNSTFLSEDGEEKRDVWPFNFVKNATQAAQLAAYRLFDSREISPITVVCKPRLRHYRPGECLHIVHPRLGLDHDVIILSRSIDPVTMKVTFELMTETPGKHDFCLGRTGVAPPSPVITQTSEERDALAAARQRPRALDIEFEDSSVLEDLKPAEAGSTRNTGALNADGLNAVDAGGPLIVGMLPVDRADPGLRNALLPLGNANRVPFSRMEGGQGWVTSGDVVAPPPAPVTFDGRFFIVAQPIPFTAANQSAFLFNSPRIPVIPGERLSVSSFVQAFPVSGPNPSFWQLYFEYYTAAGEIIGNTQIGTGATGVSEASGRFSGFATVPADARTALLVVQAISSAAGSMQLGLLEPMVTSAASGQTVHPPFTPGPNGVDGATRNTGALNADGLNAVDAGGPLLIGQLPTDKADPGLVNTNVPLGSNAVVNSEFTRGKFGWRAGSGALDSQWGVNLTGTPNWFGQRNVMWMTAPGAFAINSALDLSPDALWEGGGLPNALQFAMPVVAGDRLAASVLGAQHRCTIQLYILIFDGAGTLISAPVVGGGTPGGAANGDPANFTHLTNFADVPSNGRWAIPMMRMLGTGESDPFIFFTEPLLSKVAAGQTTAPRYTPGRADSLADETATAQRSIVPQFPIIEIKQGEAGNVGDRVILHSARRGTDTIVGGTWSLPDQVLGAGSATIASSTGTVTIAGVNQSGSYTIRYTHTDGIATDLAVNVTYVPTPVAPGSATASGAISNVSGGFFQQISPDLAITLPSGITSATLSAVNVDLELIPEAPAGSTVIQFQWQHETTPGNWADVGAAATSSPSPSTVDTGLVDGSNNPVYGADPGLITITHTITGLGAGSAQRFRLMGRISGGNDRLVIVSGTATASS